jgi:virulence-associated protein VagC
MKLRCKVWKNKSNGQKLVTIPKNIDINEGDEVLIEKSEENENV